MRIRCKLGMVAVAVLSAGALAPAAASADSYTVTTTADSVDGSCTASLCSLRDAVIAADAASGDSSISVPVGTYTLTIAPTGLDDNTTGDLNLTNSGRITITGAGAGTTTIDANYLDRAFSVSNGASAEIDGVTIQNGRPGGNGTATSACPSTASTTAAGGAVYSQGTLGLANDVITGNIAAGSGGGVEDAQGSGLTVTGTKFTDNLACPTSSAGSLDVNDHSGFGGGLNEDNGSALSVDHSSFTGNGAPAADGGGLAIEGLAAVFSRRAGARFAPASPYQISTSTVTGNTADFHGGGAYLDITRSAPSFVADTFSGNSVTSTDVVMTPSGGGIFSTGSDATLINTTLTGNTALNGGGIGTANGTLKLSYSTVSANTATGGTGNLAAISGTYNLDDTIVAQGVGTDNTPSNCSSGSSLDSGYNLFDDTSDSGAQCGSAAGKNDVITASPGLGALADNGGPTQTQALAASSPAIDAGNDSVCASETLGVDQRGVARPIGAHCDIGAFEYGGADLALAASAAKSAIAVGGQDTVTDTVTNSGPSYATGVKFTDPGAGYTIVSVTPSQGTCTTFGDRR